MVEVDLLPAQIDQLAPLRSRAKRVVSKGEAGSRLQVMGLDPLRRSRRFSG